MNFSKTEFELLINCLRQVVSYEDDLFVAYLNTQEGQDWVVELAKDGFNPNDVINTQLSVMPEVSDMVEGLEIKLGLLVEQFRTAEMLDEINEIYTSIEKGLPLDE